MAKKISPVKLGPTKVGLCKCGHLGGGIADLYGAQQHCPRFDAGHGSCKRCSCRQFTWIGWATPAQIKKASAAEKAWREAR